MDACSKTVADGGRYSLPAPAASHATAGNACPSLTHLPVPRITYLVVEGKVNLMSEMGFSQPRKPRMAGRQVQQQDRPGRQGNEPADIDETLIGMAAEAVVEQEINDPAAQRRLAADSFLEELKRLYDDPRLNLYALQTYLRNSRQVVCCGQYFKKPYDYTGGHYSVAETLYFLAFTGKGFALCRRAFLYDTSKPFFDQPEARIEKGDVFQLQPRGVIDPVNGAARFVCALESPGTFQKIAGYFNAAKQAALKSGEEPATVAAVLREARDKILKKEQKPQEES